MTFVERYSTHVAKFGGQIISEDQLVEREDLDDIRDGLDNVDGEPISDEHIAKRIPSKNQLLRGEE